jgi:phenylalanyl-tRNA synthetase beta chain
MKALRSWIEDYVKLNEGNVDIADRLSHSSFPVDSIISGLDRDIVVAKILSVSKHPNADKLSIAKVFDGENNYSIVCGAPNIKTGQYVPLAKAGARVGEIEIKESDIRGARSEGMLCSELELGVGDDHTGIMVLPEDTTLGVEIGEIIKSDAIFDIDITPNRGDCLSHYGIARELSALYSMNIAKEPIKLNMSGKSISDQFDLEVRDSGACPQYMARLIEGVDIHESPEWLQCRLKSVGISSINNVVDVTNYILLDLGQPLHAFDADKIKGKKIVVRFAKDGERITFIDHSDRKLSKGNLVIADAKDPIAVAGIMGGLKSEISASTKNILIESAEFDRKAIRKSSKLLMLSTEASHRFERGIDPSSVEYALNKAAKMIKEIASGKISPGLLQSTERSKSKEINVNYSGINSLLGLDLNGEEIDNLLRKVGFEIKEGSALVPAYRHDVDVWQDLAEEVGRLYGYDKINTDKLKLPKLNSKNWQFAIREQIKDLFTAEGFFETMSYSFIKNDDIANFKLDKSKLLKVANPFEKDDLYLRPTLLPNLLKVVTKNQSFDDISIFEIGTVFGKTTERFNIAAVVCDKSGDIVLNAVAKKIQSILSTKISVDIIKLDDDLKNILKIRKSACFYIEISLETLYKNIQEKKALIKYKKSFTDIVYRPVSRYPSVIRDLAFIADKRIKAQDVIDFIYSISANIQSVDLFDEFKSDKFGKNNKNIAFKIFIQDLSSSMEIKNSDKIVNEVVERVNSKFKTKIRDF